MPTAHWPTDYTFRVTPNNQQILAALADANCPEPPKEYERIAQQLLTYGMVSAPSIPVLVARMQQADALHRLLFKPRVIELLTGECELTYWRCAMSLMDLVCLEMENGKIESLDLQVTAILNTVLDIVTTNYPQSMRDTIDRLLTQAQLSPELFFEVYSQIFSYIIEPAIH